MKVTAVFPAKSKKELTTSELIVVALAVYELRGTVRGLGLSTMSGYDPWALAKSELDVSGDLKKRRAIAKLPTGLEGLLRESSAWYAGGRSSIYESTDEGATWRKEAIPLREMIVAIARHEGTLWIAGVEGGLAYRNGDSWSLIERPKAPAFGGIKVGSAHAYPVFAQTRLRVVGDTLYALGHGLWQVSTKKAELVTSSKSLLIDLAVTTKGTLLAVGTDGTVLRRAGKKWESTSVGKAANVGVVALDGGALLVATDALYWSTDDGMSFARLADSPELDPNEARFHLAVADGHGGALVAGWRGLLVRVSNDGLGPWANVKKSAATASRGADRSPPPPEPRRPTSAKDEASFLADIVANADDDGPRLVFADWLIEHGDPRGELIQVQCQLQRPIFGAKGRPSLRWQTYPQPPNHLALEKREQELLKQMTASLAPIRKYFYEWYWQRGFLSELTVNGDFFPGAKAVLAAHPIRRLSITGLKKTELPKLASLDLGPVRWLDLSRNRLTAGHAKLLCGPNFAQIESLFLWHNELGDDGVQELARTSHLGNLRELGVPRCSFRDQGLHALGASSILAKLEKLSVGNNEISEAALTAFAKSKGLPALKILGVGWNPAETLEPSTLTALRKRFDIESKLRWEPYN